MRTLLYAAISFFISALPIGVHALVLGDEQIHSTLEEPLSLDIRLLDGDDVDLERVEVGLASREDFEAFDLPYPSYLQDLEFTLEASADDSGSPVIRVSGSRPMVEPYLNILVSARWPGGAVLREYVVLLDLPGTPPRAGGADSGGENGGASRETSGDTGSEAGGESSGVGSVENAETTADQTSSPAPEPAAEAPLPGPGGEPDEPGRRHYVVQPGDTLWQIARRFHPEGEAENVYQTVISLHELNPGAFVNTNITLMKANQRLRIPTLAEIREVDAELAQQIYESRLTQGQARVTALEQGETMPEFTDFAVLGSEVIRESVPAEPDPTEEETSVPGREQPSPDDSGLRMASGDQALNPVPVEEEAAAGSESVGRELSPEEERLQEELAMLESLLLERENAIAALETEVDSLSGQLEEAENAVSRLTSALQQSRDDAGAAQQQQQAQVSDNRSIIIAGGLSGLLALLLLLAGVALFRMRQRLEEQREELDALTGAETTGPVAGYERQLDTRDGLSGNDRDNVEAGIHADKEPDTGDEAGAFDEPRAHDSPDHGEGMYVDDLTHDETPEKDFPEPVEEFEEPLKGFEEPVAYFGEPAADIGEPAEDFRKPVEGVEEEDEERVPYSIDMSNFDEDDAPEMFEYPISETPSADLPADDRIGGRNEEWTESDDPDDEIESIDFSLDDLLADLDDEDPDHATSRDSGEDVEEGDSADDWQSDWEDDWKDDWKNEKTDGEEGEGDAGEDPRSGHRY